MDSGILSKLSANGPIIVNSHRCQNTETGLQKLTSPRNNRLLFNSGDAAEPSRSQFHLIY